MTEPDKIMHFQVGFTLAFAAACTFILAYGGRFHERAVLVPFLAPLLIATAAGAGKEWVIDGVADWADFTATIWGGFVAAACLAPLNIAWIVVRRLGAGNPNP